MPRLFIGVELSTQTKLLLNNIALDLSNNFRDLKLVQQDNLHLTLKFLGDTQESKLVAIISTLREVAKIFRKFSFTLDAPGCFPKANNATVFWIGVRHGFSELSELAKEIDIALGNIGFHEENKPFKPHITIARMKKPTAIHNAFNEIDISEVHGRVVNVTALTIFKSTLSAKGAIYEVIEKISLNP